MADVGFRVPGRFRVPGVAIGESISEVLETVAEGIGLTAVVAEMGKLSFQLHGSLLDDASEPIELRGPRFGVNPLNVDFVQEGVGDAVGCLPEVDDLERNAERPVRLQLDVASDASPVPGVNEAGQRIRREIPVDGPELVLEVGG